MNPVVTTVEGLHDQLVKVRVGDEPIEPEFEFGHIEQVHGFIQSHTPTWHDFCSNQKITRINYLPKFK